MSKLNAALQAAQPGLSRLRSGGGGMNYRAATIEAEKPRSGLLDSIGKFAEIGQDVYKNYDQYRRNLADERSNEIIRKLTPEQRRKALNDGTLLYQDDPYAMEALRVKTGRNAAFLADDKTMQMIKQGRFKTREEMEEFRHKTLQEDAKFYAEQFGIDPDDIDFQRGFNGDITERNVSLYGAHDAFLSDRAQKAAMVNTTSELNSVLSDPELLANGKGAEFFSKYIAGAINDGSLPNDDLARQSITTNLDNVANRVGGATFLMQIENAKVKLHGVETTYKELLGDAQWHLLMQKAQSAQFEHNAKLAEKFELDIGSALNDPDPASGWNRFQALKEELDKWQPSEEMTPQRQQLIRGERILQDRMYELAAKQQKERDAKQQSMNRMAVIENQFERRFAGEFVSMDYADMPTNENTGDFTQQDMVNFADYKFKQIDAMDIPQSRKDNLKMKYLRMDSKNGAFRAKGAVVIDDATMEWQSAVTNGVMPTETPAMDRLRNIRNADPDTFAALYPEKAAFFAKLDMMDKQGVDPQVLISAEQARASRSKDQQVFADTQWREKVKTKGVLAMMPASVEQAAREVYDAYLGTTGNEHTALQAAEQYIRDSQAVFETEGGVFGGSQVFGMVPKNVLQMTDDPNSWKIGMERIQALVDNQMELYPYAAGLTVRVDGDLIRVINPNGKSVTVDPEMMRKEYLEEQRQAYEKRKQEALEKATKRVNVFETIGKAQTTKANALTGMFK